MKSQLIPDSVWSHYKKIVNNFIDQDSGKQRILWKKSVSIPLLFGEDSGQKYINVYLDCLIQYNSFRTWPINKETVSGELDDQNMAIFISANQLRELGYLNSHGYFDFDRSLDRFVVNGILYKASGDTQVSQAKDEPLLFQIILKREENQNFEEPQKLYKVYYGDVPANKDSVTEEEILAMNNENLESLPFTHTFKLVNEKSLFAVHESLLEVKSIVDSNGFEYINSYIHSDIYIQGELYHVYILELPTVISKFNQTINT